MNRRIEIDARGLLCPLPVLKARKRLLAMAPGDEICLLADDPMARIDLPHFCTQSGHLLLESEERADGMRFVIRCGDRRGDAPDTP